MEKLDFLIKYLIKENKNINIEEIPQNINDKKRLYRSLCNIREAEPISEEYIKTENEFLQEEILKKGIIDSKDIAQFEEYKGTKICLWIIYDKVTNIEEKQLANCYINSLKIVKENNIKTIAFPCISTGEFRFPKDLASKIAIEAIKEYLNTNEEYFEKIIFNVFSDEDYDIYLKNLED